MDEVIGIQTKRRKRFADLYGTVTLAERADGYFYVEQPRDAEEPYDEKDERIAFSRETAEKLHAQIGAWLKSS